jgi:hypothetical protein
VICGVRHTATQRSDVIKTIEDGAFALLKDTAISLSNFPDLEYIVIGGWCPVLRNSTAVRHPGTLDVDILFKDSYQAGNLKYVIEAFIDTGFMPSAKHPFQLLKSQEINGKRFIYNIDLLHPNMTENPDQLGMFVDHLELDVPLNNSETKLKEMKSIVLPNSEILFRESLFDKFTESGETFNLVSFDGMFITKMDSCQKQKRERDSFDIYLAFLNEGVNVGKIKSLATSDSRIEESYSDFKKHLKKNSGTFNKNVLHFCKSITGSPAKEILSKLNA